MSEPFDPRQPAALCETCNEIINTRCRVVQSGAVTFPQATGTWGTISHWALVSTGTYGAGDMYAHGSFTTPFAPVNGNTPTIPSAELEVEISATAGGAGFTDYLVHNWLNRGFRNQAFAKPAVGGTLDNTHAITFNVPSASWGLVVSMFLVDSATPGAGNVLGYDNANIVDQTPISGDTVQFAIGALDLTIT